MDLEIMMGLSDKMEDFFEKAGDSDSVGIVAVENYTEATVLEKYSRTAYPERAIFAAMPVQRESSIELDGVPSGEHGDGLLRTPYLKEIWGEVYPYFEKAKKIFDPNFILNPLCIVPVRDYKVSEFLKYYKGYSHKKAGALNRFVDEIEACHGCGKCAEFCPVARSHEGESGSSRARINLLREIISGHLKEPFKRRDLLSFFNLCLHCKTCARECPTRVDVARIIESYFEEQYRQNSPDFADRMLSRSRILGNIFTKVPWATKKMVRSSPAEKIAGALGIANLKHMELDPLRAEKAEVREGLESKKCVIFTGCVGDFFNASEIKAALALLQKMGFDADILSGFCCGEPAFVRGLKSEGLEQLKKSIFQLRSDIEAEKPVIFTSPSCILPFLEHSEVILGKKEAEKFKKGLHEACSFLVDHFKGNQAETTARIHGMDSDDELLRLAVRKLFRPANLKIAVQIPCHLKVIGADHKLISLIQALPGTDVIELETKCCGFGGSRGFEKKWAHHAERIGENLRDEIQSFQPQIVISSCVTCRFQIRKLLGERTLVSEYDDFHKYIRGEEQKCERIHVVHPLILAHELLL